MAIQSKNFPELENALGRLQTIVDRAKHRALLALSKILFFMTALMSILLSWSCVT